MLPFLQKKHGVAGLIMEKRKANGDLQETSNEPQDQLNPALMAAAHDILSAMHMNDANKLAQALKAAFEICDSEPHSEGPHINQGEM